MSARTTARKIVAKLFSNGQGDKVDRLVLTTVDGRDLGGWGRGAVEDLITGALSAPKKPKRK